jgi:amidase
VAGDDQSVSRHDLLLMPTLPMRATSIPDPETPRAEVGQRAFEMLGNTCPTDVTGHPAVSLPCGRVDDLPAGLTLVGAEFDDPTLYRAAHAFQQNVDSTRIGA